MSADLGTARAFVILDTSKLAQGVSAASAQFSQLEGSTRGLSSALSDVSSTMGLIGGAITAGVGLAVGTFGNFEQQVNALGAVSGATADQLGQLSDLALQIGQDTSFGATEAANALTELAKAGVPLEDILAGAGRAAVDLATATGTDLATAANAVANSLNLFQADGLKAADAVDILTAAANASSADLGGMEQGLRNLGPVAVNLGISFQDTSAAIAYFTKFGLKAADAGVSLARAIDHASAPTDAAARRMHDLGIAVFDLQGRFIGLPALFALLHKQLAGLTDAQRTQAITTIFGAEAQDVINIAVHEGADGYVALAKSITPAGQAAAATEARMKGLNGAIEQMKGSVETASIAFGAGLAPAVERVAGMVEQAANAFAALSPHTQAIAGAVTAAAGGFLLLGAALGKTLAFAIDAVGGFTRLAAALRESATAMSLFQVATGPVGVAIAAATLLIGGLVAAHLRAAEAAAAHKRAMDDLNGTLRTFAQFVSDLRVQGLEDAANAAELLSIHVKNAATEMDRAATAFDKGESVFGKFALQLANNGGNTDELRSRIEALTKTIPEMQAAMQQPGSDVLKLAREFSSLTDAVINGQLSAEDYTTRVHAITDHLDKWQATAVKAKDATTDLAAAQAAAAAQTEEQAKAQQKFNEQLDQTVAGAVNAIAGIEDVGTALDGMQEGFGRAGDSVETLLARLGEAGKIDLTPAQVEALDLERALQRLEEQGKALRATIAQDQGDMSMWAGNISLVTDVLGGNTDALANWMDQLAKGNITLDQFKTGVGGPDAIGGFEKLQALLDSGAISQETFNKAQAAGIFLLQRSAGGMQDEREQLVGDVIALAAFVKAHDDADGAVRKLTDAQRGFLSELQSTSAQTAIQTLNLLALLAQENLIEPTKVIDVAVEMGQADPALKALLDQLGLIPDEKSTDYTLTGDGTQQAKDAKKALDDIPTHKTVNLDFAATGDGSDLLSGKKANQLADVVVAAHTKLDPPDTTALDTFKPAAKTVPTKLDPPDDSAVTAYQPTTITIPTKLSAPLTDLVDNYQPTPITIPTHLGTPGFQAGQTMKGPDDVVIPTKLGTPDDTAITDYVAPTVEIPTALKAPGSASVGDQSTVEIPTKLGTPDAAAVTAYAPAPVTVPTVLGTPAFPAGMVFKPPDPITIATVLGTPDTTALDAFAKATYTTKLDADAAPVAKKVNDTITGIQNEYVPVWESSLDADATPVTDALDGIETRLEAYAQSTFEATLTADATDAANDLSEVIRQANAFAKTYTATLTVDTTAAETAIQKVANLLPASPAKEGPLSKEPSFDYVVDAFVKSMEDIARLADQAAVDLGPRVSASIAGSAVAAPLAGGQTAAAGAGWGQTYLDQRQFFALKTEEFAGLLRDAQRGGDAHAWIARRATAGVAVGA